MAGRGRGAGEGEGITAGVSERLMFTHADPTGEVPLSLRELRSPAGLSPPSGGALQPASPTGTVGRIRKQLGRASLPALRRSVAVAAATEMDRGIGFLLMPVFLAAGVIYYFSLSTEPDLYRPLAAVALMAVCAAVSRSWQRTHLVFMATLFCALGFLAAKVETWRMATPMLGSEIQTRLTGRLVTAEAMANGRVRLTIDLMSTEHPTLRYAPDRVRVSARRIPPGMTAGSMRTGYVKLLPPTGPVRPDSYDFSFDSYFSGIGGSGFFLGDPKLLAPASTAPTGAPFGARVASAVENAREGIAGHIRNSIGGSEGEIAAALIVGVRAGIPDEINESMRRTGIYHIISISGLHMALVAGTIMFLLRGAFALFPDFSSRRPVKKYAAAIALASIAAYLVISGIVVAAERSFIMLAVMLVAVLFDRAALTMRNLAISAIAVILVSPHEVVGPSFQMSFAATAALVGAYAGFADYRAGKATAPPAKRSFLGYLSRKLAVGVGGAAVTSLIAGSATLLFAIWHFQRVSPLSLLANLAVMPIVSLIVMPFAVLSALAMPFGFDGPFLYVMGKGLTAMIAISAWISERSPVDAVGLISIQSVLLATIALVIATMATTWLRLAAVPFALAALLAIPHVRTPDVLISEDAHLVAMPIGGGELAVNRERSNEFTTDNWKRALKAEAIVPPETFAKDALDIADPVDLPPGSPFYCTGDLCIGRHPSGAIVALAENRDSARAACGFADLIVINDATAYNPCWDPRVLVVTKRQLARDGSAAVFFDPQSATARAAIQYAVEEPYRPWHEQRNYTREARGLPPYEKPDRAKPSQPDQ
ncbi:ComEC/Rec2 family competence protein [Mesorhizobium sp. M2D.F.Ca.ET.185.01.1.1]|uniref:ComEC/Rec2 family competence protein n=2 Tax=Mesorhizobium TaxID=68287 RepID=UPI000FCBC260|nr:MULTISPECIES: ComEC/Rec2 family competence protein [unclassified Mesorhizobium]TGP80948.1 ComEC/Rec2 family competence protein [bacterium M00.F.Ca.ET.227.01.1.1]TGP90731.1 ComEC/Rec2 family competence protein [bacterium M00.F.Ca.ET.221.01.1.1]TGP97410.1 ComEC/Rec2 family competence protein [bacterium M00.F.Ca.ET.222.01.1.1]TGU07912.1 ComEC/Rec2 family competence protein [bacterium M00.F.Ca.ET.163.01.1.1]TGU17935.1 ComEC/Rec2 family competence protein [bacterium M00.F.Ca.ET.156.01.1.1]TGU47